MGQSDYEPGYLLEWMSHHHLPLELFREEETQLWVVADASGGGVLASGETAFLALSEACVKEVRA